MTNIERAMSKLDEYIFGMPLINLNDYRAEIVALMRADNEFPRQGSRDEAFAALAALAAKILGEQG